MPYLIRNVPVIQPSTGLDKSRYESHLFVVLDGLCTHSFKLVDLLDLHEKISTHSLSMKVLSQKRRRTARYRIADLRGGESAPMAGICAPAGGGKSTLVQVAAGAVERAI